MSTGRDWTGSELHHDVHLLAKALVNHGVQKGDVIALFCDDQDLGSTAVACLAVMSCGAIYTGGDFNSTEREIRAICADAAARLVIASPSTIKVTKKAVESVTTVREVMLLRQLFDLMHVDGTADAILPVVTGRDIALYNQSSGTTGPPKTIARRQRAVVAFSAALSVPGYDFCADVQDGGSDSGAMLVPAPLYHMADILLLLNSVVVGKQVALHSYARKVMHAACSFRRADSTFLVSCEMTHFARIAADQRPEVSLKDVVVGGAMVPEKVAADFRSKYNIEQLRNIYGSTEMGAVAMTPSKNVVDAHSIGVNCSGIPCAGVEIKIVDRENGTFCSAGQIGEICVRSEQLCDGYVNNSAATQAAFDQDGYFYSGDAGYINERGFLVVTGRYKEVIKSMGIQVSPTELESILLDHPAVVEAVVVGVPDDVTGETGLAFVIADKCYSSQITSQDLVDYVARQVVDYKQLRGGVVFLEDFPRTLLGKVDKQKLRKLALSGGFENSIISKHTVSSRMHEHSIL